MMVELRELPEDALVSDEPTVREYDSEHYNESRAVPFRDEIVEQTPNLVEWSEGNEDDVEYDDSEYSLFQRTVMELSFMERYWIMHDLHEEKFQRYFHRCGENGIRYRHALTIWANWYVENKL